MAIIQHTIETPYMVGPVHCYTALCAGELVLFDTGPPTTTGQRYLQEHIDLDRLKHVIVTHCHVDHYGQLVWLEQNSDATFYLPFRDIQKVRHNDTRVTRMFEVFEELGFVDECLARLRETFTRGGLLPRYPQNYLVAENDIPERLGISVLTCPGHSQSDLVYCGEDWAVTGDTLLRGIFQSPLLDIDLETGERFKNYQAYCQTTVTLFGLRDKRILPGHREMVESVEKTLLFYVSKLLRRVRQLKPYFNNSSVADIISKFFSHMHDPFHIYLKSSEILFMLDFLEKPEELVAALNTIGLVDELSDPLQRALD